MALHADLLTIKTPARCDIRIVQGDDRVYIRTLRKRNQDGSYTPYDITGCTLRLQVRECYESSSVLIAATVVVTANAAQGEFSETWSAASTAALHSDSEHDILESLIGVYDLEISDGTRTITLKTGKAYLVRQVSKA